MWYLLIPTGLVDYLVYVLCTAYAAGTTSHSFQMYVGTRVLLGMLVYEILRTFPHSYLRSDYKSQLAVVSGTYDGRERNKRIYSCCLRIDRA